MNNQNLGNFLLNKCLRNELSPHGFIIRIGHLTYKFKTYSEALKECGFVGDLKRYDYSFKNL